MPCLCQMSLPRDSAITLPQSLAKVLFLLGGVPNVPRLGLLVPTSAWFCPSHPLPLTLAFRRLASVFVSCCYYNNHKMVAYKTNALTVLEVNPTGGSLRKARVCAGLCSLGGSWGESVSLPFPTSRDHLHFLVLRLFLHLQSHQHNTSSLSLLSL